MSAFTDKLKALLDQVEEGHPKVMALLAHIAAEFRQAERTGTDVAETLDADAHEIASAVMGEVKAATRSKK